MTPGAFGGREAKARKALSVPGERLPPNTGGTDTLPGPNEPSVPDHSRRQPRHPSLLPASPPAARRLSDRAPERRRRVAPPLPESPRPTGPLAPRSSEPGGGRMPGPGLPGSSRAYLRGGRGLGLQSNGWTEPRTRRRGKKEARGPLRRPAGESSLSAGASRTRQPSTRRRRRRRRRRSGDIVCTFSSFLDGY